MVVLKRVETLLSARFFIEAIIEFKLFKSMNILEKINSVKRLHGAILNKVFPHNRATACWIRCLGFSCPKPLMEASILSNNAGHNKNVCGFKRRKAS